MFFRIIEKEALGDLLAGLQETFDEVAGPQKRGSDFVFDTLQSIDDLCLDYGSTILPPKKYFLAPDERLLRFNRRTGDVSDTEPTVISRALLGVHACDINALLLLDEIFLGNYIDPYYEAARKSTFIVGVSCMPEYGHICNAFGTDEVHRGFDLFLTDLEDRYFLSVLSVAGTELVEKYLTEAREITAEDLRDFQERTTRFKEAFPDPPVTDQLPLLYDAKYNDEALWEELGGHCLACGACSMVCPVCYCFDVRDTLDASGETGLRHRTWDACLFSEFAEVAHGHNFRPTRASRVRYRFYHKFVGNFARSGKMLCVGCGRCVRACKANITPSGVIAALQRKEKAGDIV
ncbi:MAG: 4Fe-4S dicluster domain-containing protein [Actinomycetia bacterium]|nr:4Fe-4S dicluster domain-containing protein [Actinomycetes bacterium]